jgi:hypothetical protein
MTGQPRHAVAEVEAAAATVVVAAATRGKDRSVTRRYQ